MTCSLYFRTGREDPYGKHRGHWWHLAAFWRDIRQPKTKREKPGPPAPRKDTRFNVRKALEIEAGGGMVGSCTPARQESNIVATCQQPLGQTSFGPDLFGTESWSDGSRPMVGRGS